MLNKEICWKCRATEDFAKLVEYKGIFDRLWKNDSVFCMSECASMFTTDNIPDSCPFALEQMLITDMIVTERLNERNKKQIN